VTFAVRVIHDDGGYRARAVDGDRRGWEQIQFLLGHVSIQTTERYAWMQQKIRIAVNDRLGIEPDAA
jgi:integrase